MLLLLGCAASPPEGTRLPGDVLVLDHVTVVDADGARTDRAVLVAGAAILDVRDGGGDWGDAEVRDARGLYVVPGLVDAHVHLAYAGTTVAVGDTLAANLRATLRHGITQVVDVGGPAVLFDVRDRDVLAPRILATGPFLTAAGSHPCETWPDPGLCRFVDADDAAAAALALADAGADAIKVALADGAFTSWGATPRLDIDALIAIVSVGLPVYAHVDTDTDVIEAVAAGATLLAHPAFADAMGGDALAAAATVRAVHTTVGAFAGVVDLVDGALDPGDPDLLLDPAVAASWAAVQADPDVLLEGWVEQSRGWTANVRANLPALRTAGATVIPGSDAGYYFVPHGAGLHRELRELVDAGWTPLEALAAATLDARRALDLPGGRIEAGAPADLLLLTEDPVLSVDALAAIDTVMLAGVPWSPDALATVDLWAGDGDLCLDDGDCDPAQRCDGLDHVCAPSCDAPYAASGSCDEASWCMPAEGAGICHAEPPCDLYAQDCAPAWYGQACVPYDVDTNGCWYGGARGVGETCAWDSAALACAPGLFCSSVDARCYELCDPDAPDTCPATARCLRQEAAPGVPWFGLCL